MGRISDEATCRKCGEKYKKEAMTEVSKGRWLCNSCNMARESYLLFVEEIRKLFNLKNPGARINATRAKLISQGYSDYDIIETLHYCLEKKNFKPNDETIGFITPELIEEMQSYKKRKEYKENIMIEAMTKIKYVERFPARRLPKKKEKNDNIIDLLGDDVI